MKIISQTFSFEEYNAIEELTSDQQALIEAARESVSRSYSPYSNFRVGASVLLDNGETITGNNQENIAYPSGLCAERVALFYAQSKFPENKVVRIAIAAKSNSESLTEPVMPCGSCRQVIAEYEDRHGTPIEILMIGETGKVLVAKSMESLLPMRFRAEFLKKE